MLWAFQAAAAATLEDPTRPPGWTPPARNGATAVRSPEAPGFVVSMLKLSATLRLAVVNGRSVREGDEVDGATVTAIDAGGVTLDYQGLRLRADAPGGGRLLGGMKTEVQ